MQVAMLDELESARDVGPSAWAFGDLTRLEFVMVRFDIRAKSWLTLVSSIQDHNAFGTMLHFFARQAWEEYTGAPPEVLQPACEQAYQDMDSIFARVPVWIKAGYQRLSELRQAQRRPTSQLPLQEQLNAAAIVHLDRYPNARRCAVNTYLEEARIETGTRITRADIWRSAGYRDSTEFERWERNDKRVNVSANRLFQSILSRKPHIRAKNSSLSPAGSPGSRTPPG